MLKDLSRQINKLKKLTASEKKLVEYFQMAKEQIALQNIYDISQGAEVSTATVTRFVARLGYTDFHDFKAKIRSGLMGRLDSSWDRYQLARKELLGDSKDQWGQFCKLVIHDLEAAHANISSQKMNKVAKTIATAAGTIYVVGQFNSYIVANLFWQQLMLLRPRVVFLNDQCGNLIHQLLEIDQEDVLFAVGYQRYAHQTTLTVKEFARKKAKVIVLNDSELSPLSKYASIELTVPVEWPAVFGSRCSGLMVVEGLAVHIAKLLEKSLPDRITHAMTLANDFDSFTNKITQRRLFKNGEPWQEKKKKKKT